jgi:hypothetical protein
MYLAQRSTFCELASAMTSCQVAPPGRPARTGANLSFSSAHAFNAACIVRICRNSVVEPELQLHCTLLEKPSVTQDHNTTVTKNSVTYKYRGAYNLYGVDGFFRSFYLDDGIFHLPRVLVLRHARLFNSVKNI